MNRSLKLAFAILAMFAAIPAANAATDALHRTYIGCAQSHLNELGFNAGRIDGVAGGNTDRALGEAKKSGINVFEDIGDSKFRAERSCIALARAAAKKNGHPETSFISDLSYNDPKLGRIREGILLVQEALGIAPEMTGYAFKDGDVFLEYFAHLRKIELGEAKRRWKHSGGRTLYKKVYFYLPNVGTSAETTYLSAHEYVHIYQLALLGQDLNEHDDGTPVEAPTWLIEGMAETISKELTGSAKPKAAYRDLSTLETWQQFQDAFGVYDQYAVSQTAVDYLVSLTSREQVFETYWKERKRDRFGTSWRTTFEQVFGFTLENFYSDFSGATASVGR